MQKIFDSKTLLLAVFATAITVLTVTAGLNATTIGTNISTDGTLTVAGATTLSSTLTVTGIATSTSALVASSTFKVYGTTREGTGTFIETIANGTDVLGSTDANGLNFKKYNGTIWGTLGRVYGGGYANALFLKSLDGDMGSLFHIYNSANQAVITFDTISGGGINIGDSSADTASTTNFIINNGAGGERFNLAGATGNITSIGNLNLTSTGSIATSSNLVASSTFKVYGTTREGTGTFIETIAQGTDIAGLTDSNGLLFKKYDGTIWGSFERLYHPSLGQYVNGMIFKNLAYAQDSMISLLDNEGNDVIAINTIAGGGIQLGSDSVDTASTSSIYITDGAGGYRLQISGASGAVETASTIKSSNTQNIGWSVVAGANTACANTCTYACVFGQDSDAAGKPIVACDSAAADICVCAGDN